MLFVNKEGSCYRSAHTNSQIELMKTRGFVPVEEEKPKEKAEKAEKPDKAEVKRGRAAAKKTENTDGSLEVTI